MPGIDDVPVRREILAALTSTWETSDKIAARINIVGKMEVRRQLVKMSIAGLIEWKLLQRKHWIANAYRLKGSPATSQ